MTSSNMEENDKQFSGDELDEPRINENDSIKERKDEPELELDEIDESSLPPIQEEENSEDIGQKHKRNNMISPLIALGLCLLIGIGCYYLREKIFDILHEEKTTQTHGLTIPEDQLLAFHSFVIPLKEKRGLTYISLSISFNVPNKELRQEIIEKKKQLRGIIYDILHEEINRREEIPSLKKIKGFLTKIVNRVLSAGKVNEVYITKFLAV